MRKAILLFLLLTLPIAAVAEECFCLVNKDDFFRHSCKMQKEPGQAQCISDFGKEYTVDVSGWTRLDAGQGRCNPCRQFAPPGTLRTMYERFLDRTLDLSGFW